MTQAKKTRFLSHPVEELRLSHRGVDRYQSTHRVRHHRQRQRGERRVTAEGLAVHNPRVSATRRTVAARSGPTARVARPHHGGENYLRKSYQVLHVVVEIAEHVGERAHAGTRYTTSKVAAALSKGTIDHAGDVGLRKNW